MKDAIRSDRSKRSAIRLRTDVPPRTVPDLLAVAANVTLCVALPVAMVIANKSAPVALALGAVLSNAAVLASGRSAVLRARFLRLIRTGSGLMIAGFFAWAVASLLWTVSPAMTVRGLRETLPELLFGGALAAAWPLSGRRWLLPLLGIGLGLAAALIVFEAYAGMPLHRLTGARAMAFDLKRSSIPPLLLLWPAVALCRDGRRFWLAAALIGCALLGSLVSHSSASVVAVLVSTAVYGLALRHPRTCATSFVAVLVALLLIAPWTGTAVSRLMSSGTEQMLAEQHASERLAIWSTFEARVWHRPWLGHGFDASFRLGDPVAGRVPTAGDRIIRDIHPHNQLLQVWIDFGVVGAVGVLAALGRLARKLPDPDGRVVAPRLAFLAGATVLGLVGVQAWDAWWLATVAVVWSAFTLLQGTRPEPPEARVARQPPVAAVTASVAAGEAAAAPPGALGAT